MGYLRADPEPQWSPVDVTGNSGTNRALGCCRKPGAAMEPGRRDREQRVQRVKRHTGREKPQWSPVDVTGNRRKEHTLTRNLKTEPQWSPVDVTGNRRRNRAHTPAPVAAMEPGRRDREQAFREATTLIGGQLAAMEPGRRDREQPRKGGGSSSPRSGGPQWSPVDVTGNSPKPVLHMLKHDRFAAMEPGRRDREQVVHVIQARCGAGAAMEPGRRDREQFQSVRNCAPSHEAAMEPGRRDREQQLEAGNRIVLIQPQWSPVDVTGNSA